MDRIERIYKIELLIKHRGCVPFETLRTALEVSRATLNRDLAYLRDRLHAPIVFDRDRGGYCFSGPGPTAEAERHELPGLWLSSTEIHALLTMHQLIEGLDGSGVLARHLQPMLERLHGMLGADAAQTREAFKRVKFSQPARRPVDSGHFEQVGGALLNRQRLRLEHLHRGRNQTEVREVSPQRLVHHRNVWYLDAWCHKAEALRRFALDALREVQRLPVRAKDIALKTLEAELDAGYGAFVGRKAQTARLRFSASAARWVAHEQWHPRQVGRRLEDGRHELSLPYTDPTELLMDLMRHGPEVEVIGPASLRRQLRERLEAALAATASPG